jgi:CheY-like chemotaxis protein
MTDVREWTAKPPRMLIADDDPAVVRLLADRCRSAGFEVETATNGVQALIKANRSHPDIMVIDVNMPEADGLTVCARLLDPSRRALNVIVVTGNRDAETVERCESYGAHYVRKGPDFWTGLVLALIDTFPGMAHQLNELQVQPRRAETRNRPRVLVIDDDPSIATFLTSRLGKYGVDTLYASDAPHGYRMACKEEPSVIITDYFMPNGDVYFLLGRLRTTVETANIPVFVWTGRQLGETIENELVREVCGHPGVARVFRKTFDTDELFGALQGICAFGGNRVQA